MTRYLGIDYGSRRIGLAVSDPGGRQANPIGQCAGTGTVAGDAAQLAEVIHAYEIEAIVVGLPLNMDDTEGPQARVTRRFGVAVGRAFGLPVHYGDERLTTHAAGGLLAGNEGLTNKKRKARRDAIAAQLMLQGFLDAHRTPSDGGGKP